MPIWREPQRARNTHNGRAKTSALGTAALFRSASPCAGFEPCLSVDPANGCLKLTTYNDYVLFKCCILIDGIRREVLLKMRLFPLWYSQRYARGSADLG